MSARSDFQRCPAPAAWTMILTVLFSGCHTPPPPEPDYMAVGTIRLPANPGLVGLVIVQPDAGFSLEGPHHRQEAARLEAAEGAMAAGRSELAALFPAAYVVGGLYGMLAGIGEDDLKAATKSLMAVCREVDFDRTVARVLGERINAAYPGRWRELKDDPPEGIDRTEGFAGRRPDKTAGSRPPYRILPRSGVQTLIRAHIVSRGFQVYNDPDPALGSDSIFHVMRQKHNPPLSLVMTVDVTATRVLDLASLGGMTVSYTSRPRSFLDWAANDARPFRQEMEAGLQLILRQLGARLDFGVQPNP